MSTVRQAHSAREPRASKPGVEIVRDMPGFAALREPWTQLLRESAADCPFLTWEWLYTWWLHLRGSAQLRIITVWDQGQLRAIAPLCFSRAVWPWFSTLQFLGTGQAGSDYLDVIVKRGFEEEACHALADAIGAQRHALRLTHLPPDPMAAVIAADLAAHGWMSRTSPVEVCPFIPLSGHSWDSYLATRGSSHRANFRRRLKALNRDFQVRLELVTSEPERHDVLAALARFHDHRWDAPGGSTAFRQSALRGFHKDVTERAHKAGWLRFYGLYLNDCLAAAMYGFFYEGRFYFYQHGFDPAYQQYSVGMVLMGLAIRSAIEEGAREFDMLYGAEPYKALWADDVRLLTRIDVFPQHISGRIYQRSIEVESTARALAKRILARDAHAT